MRNKKGFTLIELLVVIAIIAILSAIGLVALNGAREKARDAQRRSDLAQIRTALNLFYDDYSGYPGLTAPNAATPNGIANCDRGPDSSGQIGLHGVNTNSALTQGLSANYLAQVLKSPSALYADRAAGNAKAYDQSHYGYLANNGTAWATATPNTNTATQYVLFVRLESGGGNAIYSIDYQGTVHDINSSPVDATHLDVSADFNCAFGAACTLN